MTRRLLRQRAEDDEVIRLVRLGYDVAGVDHQKQSRRMLPPWRGVVARGQHPFCGDYLTVTGMLEITVPFGEDRTLIVLLASGTTPFLFL